MMKVRALVLGLLMVVQAASAELTAPQWVEFAPPEYLNAQLGQSRQPMSPAVLMGSFFVPGLILVTAPVAMVKKRQASEDASRNYWAARRNAFESEIATCEAASTDKAMCYLQVRQMEAQKTQAWVAHQDSLQLRAAVRSRR